MISLALLLACVGFLPYSILYAALILFSLNSLISNFFIVKAIEEHVLGIKEPTPEALPEEAEEESFQQPNELPEWEEEGEN